MAAPVTSLRRLPLIPAIVGGIGLLLLALGAIYLARPAKTPEAGAASTEATAYLPNLILSDVSMQASENFMKQQVIEVTGTIVDYGPRSLRSIEVYCIFYGINGQEIHRERLPIVSSKLAPLRPGEKRAFRLPFDALPDGWNQSIPKMVIAQITFAQ